jgi:hypothetical protein
LLSYCRLFFGDGMSEPIKCLAVVYKVQTLTDHGIRISLDLPETAIMQMAMFAECQRMQVLLDVECNPVDRSTGGNAHDNKQGRPETKSLRGS